MTELWKNIKEFEDYSVSNLGRIKNNRLSRYLTPTENTAGYLHVRLYKNPRKKVFRVHKLVAIEFLGEIPTGLEVNHKDGVKTNNRLDNLEYLTHKENVKHAIKLGLVGGRRKGCNVCNNGSNWPVLIGEDNYSSKLTELKVLRIRRLYKYNAMSKKALGRIFCVSNTTIRKIVNRVNWKHI